MMNIRLLFLAWVVALSVSGCAGMFGSVADPSNEIHVREDGKPSSNAKQEKYPITIRVAAYADARGGDSPRRLGISTSRVMGITGKDLMLDREVELVVADSMKKHLGDVGLQVLTDETSKPQFLLSGSVKELSIDIKERDYANIAIESSLTELASGKVIWSGVVVEKTDRYAGSAGNSKRDIADYLRRELGIVTGKTSESILSVLMSSRPDLFNLAVGAKPIAGVTIYSNSAMSPSSAVVPATTLATEPAMANGTLAVSTKPGHAKVYVDGVYFGLTPLRAEIAVGVHEVSVKLDGHQTATEKVSIRKDDSTELEMKLQR